MDGLNHTAHEALQALRNSVQWRLLQSHPCWAEFCLNFWVGDGCSGS